MISFVNHRLFSPLVREGTNRVFPWENIWTDNTTVEACLDRCALYGYPAAGLEFGNQCFCGDVSDVTTNSAGPAPETDCNIPCSGDPLHLCGGPLRLQVCFCYHALDSHAQFQTRSTIPTTAILMFGIHPLTLADMR